MVLQQTLESGIAQAINGAARTVCALAIRPEDRSSKEVAEIASWVHSLATGFFRGISLCAAGHLAPLLEHVYVPEGAVVEHHGGLQAVYIVASGHLHLQTSTAAEVPSPADMWQELHLVEGDALVAAQLQHPQQQQGQQKSNSTPTSHMLVPSGAVAGYEGAHLALLPCRAFDQLTQLAGSPAPAGTMYQATHQFLVAACCRRLLQLLPEEPRGPAESAALASFMAQLTAFRGLPVPVVTQLAATCVPVSAAPGAIVTRQGDEGDISYVLISGALEARQYQPAVQGSHAHHLAGVDSRQSEGGSSAGSMTSSKCKGPAGAEPQHASLMWVARYVHEAIKCSAPANIVGNRPLLGCAAITNGGAAGATCTQQGDDYTSAATHPVGPLVAACAARWRLAAHSRGGGQAAREEEEQGRFGMTQVTQQGGAAQLSGMAQLLGPAVVRALQEEREHSLSRTQHQLDREVTPEQSAAAGEVPSKPEAPGSVADGGERVQGGDDVGHHAPSPYLAAPVLAQPPQPSALKSLVSAHGDAESHMYRMALTLWRKLPHGGPLGKRGVLRLARQVKQGVLRGLALQPSNAGTESSTAAADGSSGCGVSTPGLHGTRVAPGWLEDQGTHHPCRGPSMAGSLMSAPAGDEDDDDDRASVSTGASQESSGGGADLCAGGSQWEGEGVSTCGDRSRTVSLGGGMDTWSSTGLSSTAVSSCGASSSGASSGSGASGAARGLAVLHDIRHWTQVAGTHGCRGGFVISSARLTTPELVTDLGPTQGLLIQAGALAGEEALTQAAHKEERHGGTSSRSSSTRTSQGTMQGSHGGVCRRHQSLVAWQGPPDQCVIDDDSAGTLPACSGAELLAISRPCLMRALRHQRRAHLKQLVASLRAAAPFASLPTAQLQALSVFCRRQEVPAGRSIQAPNTADDQLHIIEEGQVLLQPVAATTPGTALLGRAARPGSVVLGPGCVWGLEAALSAAAPSCTQQESGGQQQVHCGTQRRGQQQSASNWLAYKVLSQSPAPRTQVSASAQTQVRLLVVCAKDVCRLGDSLLSQVEQMSHDRSKVLGWQPAGTQANILTASSKPGAHTALEPSRPLGSPRAGARLSSASSNGAGVRRPPLPVTRSLSANNPSSLTYLPAASSHTLPHLLSAAAKRIYTGSLPLPQPQTTRAHAPSPSLPALAKQTGRNPARKVISQQPQQQADVERAQAAEAARATAARVYNRLTQVLPDWATSSHNGQQLMPSLSCAAHLPSSGSMSASLSARAMAGSGAVGCESSCSVMPPCSSTGSITEAEERLWCPVLPPLVAGGHKLHVSEPGAPLGQGRAGGGDAYRGLSDGGLPDTPTAAVLHSSKVA